MTLEVDCVEPSGAAAGEGAKKNVAMKSRISENFLLHDPSQIDSKFTPNRSQILSKSTPNRPQITSKGSFEASEATFQTQIGEKIDFGSPKGRFGEHFGGPGVVLGGILESKSG